MVTVQRSAAVSFVQKRAKRLQDIANNVVAQARQPNIRQNVSKIILSVGTCDVEARAVVRVQLLHQHAAEFRREEFQREHVGDLTPDNNGVNWRMEKETWFSSARIVPPQSTTAAAPIPIVGARWSRSAGCGPSRAAPPVAAWTQRARAARFRER